MIYELRTYEILPGQAAVLHERFASSVLGNFEKHGMQNVGYWSPLIGEFSNQLIYMLGFESLAHRERAWATYQQDPDVQASRREADEKHGPQVKRITNMLLQPTPYSPPIGGGEGSAAVCELRIYDTLPGKAQPLHDRFANVTSRLFEKHGMTNVGYWTPVVGGYSNQLYYMLGFEDLAQREKAWASFQQDPEWQAASRATSEQHGVVLEKLTNVMLRPTPYSPLR